MLHFFFAILDESSFSHKDSLGELHVGIFAKSNPSAPPEATQRRPKALLPGISLAKCLAAQPQAPTLDLPDFVFIAKIYAQAL